MHHLSRDELDRDEKLLIDTLRNPAEARRRLEAARCNVVVDPSLLQSRLAQIAMLSIAATLSRSHRGGVTFVVGDDVPLVVRGKQGNTLFSELCAAGGRIGPMTSGTPTIAIGDVSMPAHTHGVRLHVENGGGGCAPLAAQSQFDADGFAPAAIMAASLASLEIFRLNALGETDAGADFKIASLVDGMTLDELIAIERRLPDHLWFIGAGHLGQASIFAATLCGIANDHRTYKVQDHDTAIRPNRSTQILLRHDDRGARKVDVCGRWLGERGITARLDCSPLDEHTAADSQFDVIIAGLDKPEPRQLLEKPGAGLVVDAGVGGLASTYASFRIHTFPGPEKALRVFARSSGISEALHREVLADFYAGQVDDDPGHVCGARDVAGVSVGVPFVGTAVAAITLTEILFRVAGLPGSWKIGGDLRQSAPISVRLLNERYVGARSMPWSTGGAGAGRL